GAAAAVLGAEMLLVAVVDQRVQVFQGLNDDVTALAAVAAVRAAELDELLAAKARRAAPAVAALQVDLALVEKLHGLVAIEKGERPGRSPQLLPARETASIRRLPPVRGPLAARPR